MSTPLSPSSSTVSSSTTSTTSTPPDNSKVRLFYYIGFLLPAFWLGLIAANFNTVIGARWRSRESSRAKLPHGKPRGIKDTLLSLFFAPSHDSRDYDNSEDEEIGCEEYDSELAYYVDRSMCCLSVFVVVFISWVVVYGEKWESLPSWLLMRSVSEGERSGW
ncbi:hypothetical protein TrLO_g15335 [Triparma laevis f. longispina]|uniref:Uncharacterized protein n=1 Tax=Triparma laevis f. longispina TaxID=1714387 RepID=A0A9W7KSP3_9STRA|nr:hypothetical protein TrLO_g15335 [Triparma laevis f. longispina]